MAIKLPVSGKTVNIDFDPAEVRARYAQERERRLRPEGIKQFVEVAGEFSHLDRDPHADPISRDPLDITTDVLIIGGGFGGLVTGAHLRDAGFDDITIIEQGGDFGGTWYWNRYPGVQCDIESYIYLPLLEETGYVPTEKYAHGAEIFEHAQRIARHYDLYRAALFQTRVTDVTWHDDSGTWVVTTDRGDRVEARFVVRANGPMNKPRLPGIPGIAGFQGRVFHTSRWDYAYTGGHSRGELSNLRDKRVAVIGTGATGIQVVPYVARDAKELYVVQRTPSAVDTRRNRPTDAEWAQSLAPGWQRERIDNFNRNIGNDFQDVDLVQDGWTELFRAYLGEALVDSIDALPPEDTSALASISDLVVMQPIHRRIETIVKDKATAEALKPWYGRRCKRPAFNDGYLESFNRDNVTLLDSASGVERITETGLVVNGVEHEVDVIIFATGFETGTYSAKRFGYDVHGKDGVTLSAHYAHGLRTLHGFFSHGFPNFFEEGLSQNGYIVNFTFMLDQKARHIARIIEHARDNGISRIEPTAEAEAAWVETVHAKGAIRQAYFTNCTPGYYNGEGNLDEGFFKDVYPSELDFWALIDDWWADGRLEGLQFTREAALTPNAG
ncbi:MAG: monooxygenase [Actinobacteria bacterium]|uniref:flavin-containing monooxygenase n=1 Tax=Microbacterium sp. NPDC076895 TaxID=3154957 RepID=UPI0010001BC4|nr:MAG: monooxygenase [Actinomycetota bacterium]